MTVARAMLRGMIIGDDFAYVRVVAIGALHGIPPPPWQPKSASQARSGD